MTDLVSVGDTSSVVGATYENGDGDQYVEVPTGIEAQRQITALRRRLVDLPDVPQKMNAISVVLAYELFGLHQHDIALATGLAEEQVGRMMMLDAYRDMRSAVVASITSQAQDDVRAIFIKKAQRSAERIVELAESGRPDIALSASKEVLDRSGNTVKEIVEHHHRVDGGLTIEYVRRDNSQEVPAIDTDFTEVK